MSDSDQQGKKQNPNQNDKLRKPGIPLSAESRKRGSSQGTLSKDESKDSNAKNKKSGKKATEATDAKGKPSSPQTTPKKEKEVTLPQKEKETTPPQKEKATTPAQKDKETKPPQKETSNVSENKIEEKEKSPTGESSCTKPCTKPILKSCDGVHTPCSTCKFPHENKQTEEKIAIHERHTTNLSNAISCTSHMNPCVSRHAAEQTQCGSKGSVRCRSQIIRSAVGTCSSHMYEVPNSCNSCYRYNSCCQTDFQDHRCMLSKCSQREREIARQKYELVSEVAQRVREDRYQKAKAEYRALLEREKNERAEQQRQAKERLKQREAQQKELRQRLYQQANALAEEEKAAKEKRLFVMRKREEEWAERLENYKVTVPVGIVKPVVSCHYPKLIQEPSTTNKVASPTNSKSPQKSPPSSAPPASKTDIKCDCPKAPSKDKKLAPKDQAAAKDKTAAKDQAAAKDKTAGKDKAAAKDQAAAKDKAAGKDKAAAKDQTAAKDKTAGKDKAAAKDQAAAKDKAAGKDKAASKESSNTSKAAGKDKAASKESSNTSKAAGKDKTAGKDKATSKESSNTSKAAGKDKTASKESSNTSKKSK